MHRNEKMRENPSFSSTLLDKIYRSIDDGDTKVGDMKFYSETMQKTSTKMSSLQRACLIEKWMEKKVSEKANADKKKKQVVSEFVRKSSHHEHDHDHELDHDGVFFSSTSISSDSSSGGFSFSSSDTESMYGTTTKTKASSCFVPPWLKPVKTGGGGRERMEERADMKIYGNLKKVKQQQQPISPGVRLASFINSLFTTGNSKKKTKGSSSSTTTTSGQVSSCSSASSFSRSCLSKNSAPGREKLRDGVKRTVRFCPVSVIVDEDSRPCGQKCLNEERGSKSKLPSVSVPNAWKIGKSPSTKREEEMKVQAMEKTRRVEEMAREFLKEYHLNQKKNNLISRDSRRDCEDEDDASSCSSSDLFELDHLVLLGNHRYEEELPVYETTHVQTNRAIANGFLV
ncbi:hypothetical protein Golax_003494 [Gossypium laxum]|uniref:Protein BIG GRAIN 1-like B n=1 Tax=Gossypium laxum TaxID=34288 RepID=A0A7J9AFS3_9ROSI|nr:hypothetical protein [Gossypium laxum]